MAVTPNASTVAGSPPLSAFTMSLLSGWDEIPPERGGRPLAAGDLILLEVRKPAPPVTCPPGWTLLGEVPWTGEDGREHTGTAFCRFIGPPEKEIPPVFTAPGEPEWEIRGHAIYGYASVSDGMAGSIVSASLPL